ncbi:MAG: hypothetical protein DI533_19115 [Cereibacter sphaeroides]|uniref:LPS-assembly lipoprotein n=1 Tax=Cereibacter sphaeroides TaxID=1063 RepID=A0A2W5UBS3_CERSP|nr:MAG: hypothetical protein DI533_19115 [Cereibacter sphaeroides]
MSSSDRRQFLSLLLTLPLVGCGFAPAYGPGAPAKALLGKVQADEPGTRDAFSFVARIEERFGRPQEPTFRLSYQISIQRVDLAVTTAGSILRYEMVGNVNWQLIDIATGKVITTGTAQSFTGSAATETTTAAQAAEDDSRLRLMRILADQVASKLVATATNAPPSTP